MERFLVSVLVLYTESGRYLLHRVWYSLYFPGLRNLKESNDVVFIFINIIKSIFRIIHLDLESESAQDKLAPSTQEQRIFTNSACHDSSGANFSSNLKYI